MTNYSINGGSFTGCHLGDTIYRFFDGKNNISAEDLQLDNYQTYLKEKYAQHYSKYTPLDVKPIINVLGESIIAPAQENISVSEALQIHNRLFILGPSGGGKTALLKYLLYSINVARQGFNTKASSSELSSLEENKNGSSIICILAELGQFRLQSGLSPLQSLIWLVGQALFDSGTLAGMPSVDGCLNLIRIDGMSVLLDGLNEVPDHLRADCLAAIDDLGRLVPHLRLVVTSRPHQVAPPPGWTAVQLCEMSNAQVEEFLFRYLDKISASQLLNLIHEIPNPLLRTPLYLFFVTELYSSGLSDFQSQLASRAAMVDTYVQQLLRRDFKSKAAPEFSHAQLAAGARALAQKHQEIGPSLLRNHAQRVVADVTGATEDDSSSLLDYLVALGILRIDGRHVRFWHQTLQDYFFAGAIAVRWKKTKKEAPTPPGWLKALLRTPTAEDSLICLPTHITDQELTKLLAIITDTNPQLAIYWLDDLLAEHRAPIATTKLLQQFSRRVRGGVRYSRLYSDGLIDLGRSAIKYFFVILICFWMAGVVLASFEAIIGYDVFDQSLAKLNNRVEISLFRGLSLMFASIPVLSILFTYANWRLYAIDFDREKLYKLLNALFGVRNIEIKSAVQTLLHYVQQSRLARSEMSALASIIQNYFDGANPLNLIERDRYLFIHITALGHIRGNQILNFLAQSLTMDNVYSLAAIRAMLIRAIRFPEERETISELSWKYWRNQTKDWRIRYIARRILVICNQAPSGRSEVVLRAIATAIGASLFISTTAFIVYAASKLIGIESLLGNGIILGQIVAADAELKGADNVVGYFGTDGYSKRFWKLIGYFAPPGILIYCLARGRIYRNSFGIPSHLYMEGK